MSADDVNETFGDDNKSRARWQMFPACSIIAYPLRAANVGLPTYHTTDPVPYDDQDRYKNHSYTVDVVSRELC